MKPRTWPVMVWKVPSFRGPARWFREAVTGSYRTPIYKPPPKTTNSNSDGVEGAALELWGRTMVVFVGCGVVEVPRHVT